MTIDLPSILTAHRAWLCGEDDGSRADLSGADLIGADLSGANLSGADLSGARGIRHASVGWSGHGECGRTLVCTEIDGLLMFGCGCFWGDAESLQRYIADSNGDYAPSRRRAMWLCAELVREPSP
jgi:hypothetical protein